MDSEKFEQELAKNLEPLDSDKDLGFHTGLQTGSLNYTIFSPTYPAQFAMAKPISFLG
jgi:hypothetical protein